MSDLKILDPRSHHLAEVVIMQGRQDGRRDDDVSYLLGPGTRREAGLIGALIAQATQHLGLELADLLGQLGASRQNEGGIAGGLRRQSTTQARSMHTSPIAQLAKG